MRRSIYVKFVLAFAVALLLATALGGFVIAHERQASAQTQQAARVGGQVGRIASMIGAIGPTQDTNAAQRLLSLLLFDRAILCAEIVDKAGAVANSAPARVGCRGSNVQQVATAPIPDTEFELRAGVSSEEATEAARDAVWSVVIFSALAVVYATVAAYIVFRRVVGEPISKILASMRDFTATGAHNKIIYAARDELGEVIGAFNAMQTRLARDSRALKDANDMLRRSAHTDALTGLPNRTALAVRAGQYCAGALASPTAAFLIDVDSFKQINDSLGHAAGDEVLRQTAERLRTAAGSSAFVARLGGDEFIVLLDGEDGRASRAAVHARIEAAFARPIVIAGRKTLVDLSVGVAEANEFEMDVDALIAQADAQMYAKKRLRRLEPPLQPAAEDIARTA